MSLKQLYYLPKQVESRWSSPENWRGQKGAGGKSGSGRKASPYFSLRRAERKDPAHVEGTSGIVRRIWMTMNRREAQHLRGVAQMHAAGVELEYAGDRVEPVDMAAAAEEGRNRLYEREGDDWSSCAYFLSF